MSLPARRLSAKHKFCLVVLAAIAGNGIGGWNIRAISQGRYLMTAILAFSAAMISGTAGREIARDRWIYVMAWALGSVVGIVGSIYIDKQFPFLR